jgi:hypothetical protein
MRKEIAMRKTRVIAMAALLAAGTTIPALAEWNHVGDVQISPDHYTNAQMGSFTGPVDRIRFHSSGRSDCENIRVTYSNGDTQEVFSGTILDGQDQTITFPDRSRRVESVSLNCRAAHDDGARIAVAADTSAFPARDIYPPSAASAGDLELLASRDFGVLNQRSLMLANSDPRSVEEIALEPVGADARCRNVRAVFDDGTSTRSVPNDGENLREGQIYRSYVGGGTRALDSIDLTCEAANGDHVKINVYAVG